MLDRFPLAHSLTHAYVWLANDRYDRWWRSFCRRCGARLRGLELVEILKELVDLTRGKYTASQFIEESNDSRFE